MLFLVIVWVVVIIEKWLMGFDCFVKDKKDLLIGNLFKYIELYNY